MSIVVLFALTLIVGVGCGQNRTVNQSETRVGETESNTGTGQMIDKEDQKQLPINLKDYKPMPMPNPEEQPLSKEDPDSEKPSVQAIEKDGKSKDAEKKNSE